MINIIGSFKKGFSINFGTMTLLVITISLILISCQSVGPYHETHGGSKNGGGYPENGRKDVVPIGKKLRDFLEARGIEALILPGMSKRGRNEAIRFVGLDGKNIEPCAIIKKNSEIVVTDPRRCDFKGTLTKISTIGLVTIEGGKTNYCQYGTKIRPC